MTNFHKNLNTMDSNEGGLRRTGIIKFDADNLPLITIITVVYNAENDIEATLKSVLSQKYGNMEYLVIDGGSSDNTLQIIKRYENRIDYWTSKKDHGIYDAMNTGVGLALGRWICFMNAGDTFFTDNSLNDVMSNKILGDIIYGDCVLHYDEVVSRRVRSNTTLEFGYGLPFCHQASFTNAKLFHKFQFNIKYKIYADYDFFLKHYHNGVPFQKVDVVVANYKAEGLSSKKTLRHYKELYTIGKHSKKSFSPLKFYYFLISSLLKNFFKPFIPNTAMKAFHSCFVLNNARDTGTPDEAIRDSSDV